MNRLLIAAGFLAILVGCGREQAIADPPDEKSAAASAVAPKESAASENESTGEHKLHVPPAAAVKPRKGDDWPKFLGPSEFGVSKETNVVEKFPESGPPIIWERKIGTGYSAPSIRGNRLVLHHRRRFEEIVECFRADTGEFLWKSRYETAYTDPYGYNNGPRCTPLLTDEHCYTYGAEGKLMCLALKTGKRVWLRDVLKDFDLLHPVNKDPNWFFGIGCTPILEGDTLIVLVGGRPNSAVVGFNAKTGKTLWQNVGKDTWNGVANPDNGVKLEWTGEEQLVSYSSPVAATIHGRRHVLCLVRQGLVSLDPASGKLNFKYWFRSRVFESVNAARPLVIGDKILLSAAYRQGSALLQVKPDGNSYKVLWRDRRNLLAHWSTPLHVDGYVYGFSGRHENEGLLKCIELKTGKVAWETTGFTGDLSELGRDATTGEVKNRKTGKVVPWPFYGRGAKIRAGKRFIVLGERGTLAIVNVDPKEFQEVCRTHYKQIHSPAWTAPVLSRGRLYLRCEDAMLCLDVSRR